MRHLCGIEIEEDLLRRIIFCWNAVVNLFYSIPKTGGVGFNGIEYRLQK